MDIKELKNNIEKGNIDNSFMIWELSDESSSIIANQYLDKISKILKLDIKYIDGIDDIPDQSFIEDTNLYVIRCDKLEDNRQKQNCIIICNKSSVDGAIKFPKLESWQVLDYILYRIKGINKEDIEWLMSLYGTNYLRLLNDISKIEIFDSSQQKFIFDSLLDDHQFDSITNLTIWDLSNAIIKKDIKSLKSILKIIKYIDISPLGLSSVLYNNFKTIMSIQLNPLVTAKDLNISDKQFFVIKKYNCGFYTNDQLIKIISMLTNIEYLYKYNELPTDYLIDYIICSIIGE